MNRLPLKLEIGIRFGTRVIFMAIAAAGIVLALILVAPKIVGGQSLSVLSGSMAPAVNTGDMVAVIPHDATEVKVGEIVAFNDPNGSGALYQHRVQSVEEDNGQIIVVTKGDANNSGETWQTPIGSEVGKVVFVVPWIGHAVGRITGGEPVQVFGRAVPLGTLALTLALFVLAAIVIAGILRGPKKEEPEEAAVQQPELIDHDQSPHFVHHTEEGPTHA